MSLNDKQLGRRGELGFTLMELIVVIIIMGVMSVGIAGFIKLSTQTYLNVTERDELLANARFSVERLNREVRNALPNSMRVTNNGTSQCLEFVPIITSTVYTEIPVAPEPELNTLDVIPFKISSVVDYSCSDCGDIVIVYPLNDVEVYQDHTDTVGKAFFIENYPAASATEIETKENVIFTEHSPTKRAYIINSPVSYCVNGTSQKLNRYANYGFLQNQLLPPNVVPSLMANDLSFDSADLPFTVALASLQRNAVVQIKLTFTRDNGNEQIDFDNAIHINNIP